MFADVTLFADVIKIWEVRNFLCSNHERNEIAVMDTGRGNLAIVSTKTRSILRYHKGITKQGNFDKLAIAQPFNNSHRF